MCLIIIKTVSWWPSQYSYPKTTSLIIDIIKGWARMFCSSSQQEMVHFFKIAFSPTQPKLCTASGDDWYVLSMRWWDLWRDYTLFVTWTDKPILPRKLTHGSPEHVPPKRKRRLRSTQTTRFLGVQHVSFRGNSEYVCEVKTISRWNMDLLFYYCLFWRFEKSQNVWKLLDVCLDLLN